MEVVPNPKPEDKTVVLDEVKDDLVAPEAELETPLLEPEGQPDPKVHPLSPGGRRFEQVYAEAKNAQRDRDAERDKRIAAEAQLEVYRGKATETQPAADKEYTWAELEAFIDQGRISRADAEAHREEVNYRKLTTKLKDDFTQDTRKASRLGALQNSIAQYMEAVPAISTVGSEERDRLNQEFEWLASVQGVDYTKLSEVDRKALELTSLRNVYGSIDSLVKRNAPIKNETHQGLPGGTPPRRVANTDQALLDGLTKSQVAHYTKMMAAGRYPGKWKDVVEELKYEPKRSR